MKKTTIYLIGQKYEIELGDEFYEYIKDDITRLNNSQNQVKDLLNLVLKEKQLAYETDKKMKNLLKKLEK